MRDIDPKADKLQLKQLGRVRTLSAGCLTAAEGGTRDPAKPGMYGFVTWWAA